MACKLVFFSSSFLWVGALTDFIFAALLIF